MKTWTMACPAQRIIENSSLDSWQMIGHGGFGHVYKARHLQWCSNVAVKVLRVEDGRSLLREVDMMLQGSSPYVIQVLGIFKGPLPFSPGDQLGLVMELMERGSLASLQRKDLDFTCLVLIFLRLPEAGQQVMTYESFFRQQKTLPGTPPWPLVFRLAHQVALGINFLHSLSPPVLHLDLKPSNVLLDPSLNAKLTDFGLSRFYHSITRLSRRDGQEEGGTLPYMPPEAFDVCYKPTKASDIYSYGILLWSIVTGRKPYENAISSIVRLQIPNGQRPSLDDIRSQLSGLAGSEGLMYLMVKSWEGNPKDRPSSVECTTSAEELYKVHKHAIVDVVHHVLKKLDQQEEVLSEQLQGLHITSGRAGGVEMNLSRSVPTGRPPVQEMAGGQTGNQTKTPRFKASTSQTEKSEVDTSRQNVEPKVKRSSVNPILSAPPTPTTVPSTPDLARRRPQQILNRCTSFFPCYSARPPPEVYIRMNHVTGIQYGSNNTMHISTTAHQERRRHPTAPPSVSLPPKQPGSKRDKKGV